jgi:hypothetical protein
MREYSKSECDEVLRETIRESVDSISPPPLEESWARFENKLKEQEKAENHIKALYARSMSISY